MGERQGTILFAGGGTGGHLFPGLAVAERLQEMADGVGMHFACSDRDFDQEILSRQSVGYTPIRARPWPLRRVEWPLFAWACARSYRQARRLLRERDVRCVLSTGGFVSAPLVLAARHLGIPSVLINLDAVPGKANQWLAQHCRKVYTVYETDQLAAEVEWIPMPLRWSVIGPDDPRAARRELGFDPDKPLLVVTGASQGAESINQTLIALVDRPDFGAELYGWQILHLAGSGHVEPVQQAYLRVHLDATVLPFSNQMGLVWSAADLAISRAGANSVAEIAANRVPTIFLPYPHHPDQHQRLNAFPLVNAGGALLLEDASDPTENVRRIAGPLIRLMNNAEARQRMRMALGQEVSDDSAARIASHLLREAGVRPRE